MEKISEQAQLEQALTQNGAKDAEELKKKVLLYQEYVSKLVCYKAFRRNIYASLHKLVVSGAQISDFGYSSKVDEQGDTIISFAFAGGVEPVAKRYNQEKLLKMQHELQEKLKYLDNPQSSTADLKNGESYVLALVEAFVTNLFNIYQVDWIDGKLD